jgi:tetratricopeptide (TPR) repeat protein
LGSLEPYFEIDRTSPDADVYLGVAYIVLGFQKDDFQPVERGIEILKEALTDTSRFGDAHYQLGLSLFTLDRLEEAVEPLETAVRLGPDIPTRLDALAQLYERLDGSPDRISELYQRALEVQPLAAPIRVNYGRFLETQSKVAEARQQYETALDHRPSLATGHYNLGTLLIKEGDFDLGEEHLAKAVQLDPDYPEAYSNLGVLLASQGRIDEARRVFEQAVDVAPDDPVALNNLASFYLNEGLDAQAVPLLKRAVDAQPSYVEALANLALALLRVGDDGEALTYAERALALDRGNELANAIAQALE